MKPDNLVQNYGWDTDEGPNSCRYLIPEILSILETLNVSRVLDIGSGNGKLCSEMNLAGFSAAGVEYDLGGVNISKTHYPNIPFYNFGVQDNPTDLLRYESAFDAVVSSEVIEHLFSPHLLPQYAHSVLKTRGFLVITTPYHGYLKNLMLSVFNKWDHHHTALWHGGHIKFWSQATLSKLLEDNGYRIIKFAGAGRFSYLWKSMVLVGQKLS